MQDLETQHDLVLNGAVMRIVFLVAAIFIATRNIRMTIFLSATYIILVKMLLNSKSKYCILSQQYIKEIFKHLTSLEPRTSLAEEINNYMH